MAATTRVTVVAIFDQRAENIAGDAAKPAHRVLLHGERRAQAREDGEREGPAERFADHRCGDHHRRGRSRQRGHGGRGWDRRADRFRYQRAKPIRPGRGHAPAAGPRQGEPAGDHRGDECRGSPAVTRRLGLAERRDLDE